MAISKIDTSSIDALGYGFKNRIINGKMDIWQRGTSFTNITSNTYSADRFQINLGNIGTGVFKAEQVSDGPAGTGFKYALKLSPTTAMSSVNAAAYIAQGQLIEGFNCADLMYGTAYAQSFTLTFWVKSNVAGLCCGTVIQNGAAAGTERSYPYNFTIATADTWQLVTVVVPGDTGGAIANNNTWGLQFNFGYMAIGSNYQNGVLNSWNANPSGAAYLASGFTYLNRASSTSNYISITGVQVEKGSTATSFDYRPYTTELSLCQRYAFVVAGIPSGSYARKPIFGNGVNSAIWYPQYPVPMRTQPTLTAVSITSTYFEGYNYTTAAPAGAITNAAMAEGDYLVGQVTLTFASGLASGSVGSWRWTASATSANYFLFSAEL